MDDFLKSKAMMPPGVAGALTTMITGTLVSQFGSTCGGKKGTAWTGEIFPGMVS